MSEQHILPTNATPIEIGYDLAFALQIAAIPVNAIWDQWDADNCAEGLLPWLAWALSVDEWDADWSIGKKRAVIKASIDVHRKRGTPGSIKDDLAALEWDTEYQEWRSASDTATPHTFTVSVINPAAPLLPSDIELINRKLHRDKAARDQFDVEISNQTSSGGVTAHLASGGIYKAIGVSFL